MLNTLNIGVIAISGKPYHSGHDALIRLASNKNDLVVLFVSLNDRKRKNEIPISGKTMFDIWKQFIEPTLPQNVTIHYVSLPETPVSALYAYIGNKNEEHSDDNFTIYSDVTDINKSYPRGSLEKYFGNLYKNNKLHLEPISRSETVNISGTMMRTFLEKNDMESFIENLPDTLQSNGEAIWNMLKGTNVV